MVGNIEMEDFPSAVLDYIGTVQNSKGESRYCEEVHRRYDFTMIVQESSPEFSGLIRRR